MELPEETRTSDEFPLVFKRGRRRTSFPPPSDAALRPSETSPAVAQRDIDSCHPAEALKPFENLPAVASRDSCHPAEEESLQSKASPSGRNELKRCSERASLHSQHAVPEVGVKRPREQQALQVLDTNLPTHRPESAQSKATIADDTTHVPPKAGCPLPNRTAVLRVAVKEEEEESESLAEEGPLAYCRKEKSLGLLCDNFMSLYTSGQFEFVVLDEAARKLGVERRRIYDIVNVFESMQVVVRKAKNRYTWHGLENLPRALAQMKEEAMQRDAQPSQAPRLASMLSRESSMDILEDGFTSSQLESIPGSQASSRNTTSCNSDDEEGAPIGRGKGKAKRGTSDSRREKSLGVLTQRFVGLFLISKTGTLSLEHAAEVLLNGCADSAKTKTKVRRLYDIANILASMQLIEKIPVQKVRRPAFRWICDHARIAQNSRAENLKWAVPLLDEGGQKRQAEDPPEPEAKRSRGAIEVEATLWSGRLNRPIAQYPSQQWPINIAHVAEKRPFDAAFPEQNSWQVLHRQLSAPMLVKEETTFPPTGPLQRSGGSAPPLNGIWRPFFGPVSHDLPPVLQSNPLPTGPSPVHRSTPPTNETSPSSKPQNAPSTQARSPSPAVPSPFPSPTECENLPARKFRHILPKTSANVSNPFQTPNPKPLPEAPLFQAVFSGQCEQALDPQYVQYMAACHAMYQQYAVPLHTGAPAYATSPMGAARSPGVKTPLPAKQAANPDRPMGSVPRESLVERQGASLQFQGGNQKLGAGNLAVSPGHKQGLVPLRVSSLEQDKQQKGPVNGPRLMGLGKRLTAGVTIWGAGKPGSARKTSPPEKSG